MPITKRFLFLTALIATAGVARAQTTDDVSTVNTNLSQTSAWVGGQIAGSSSAVTFNSSGSNLSTLFTSGYSSTTWNSIVVSDWSAPISMNTGNSNVIGLNGSTAISLTGQSLSLGTLNIENVNSGTVFNISNGRTLTDNGAIITNPGWTETVTVNGGGTLNLTGNSNSAGGSSGTVNLTLENGSDLALGGNSSQTFNKLTIDNDNTTITLNSTVKTAETFSGGLFINPNVTLTIDGWQGQVGTAGTAGQLFFSKTNQLTNYELTNVVFDLSTNTCGQTTDDYGMFITDPDCSSLYELVPYAAVPEPTTIFAGLALLGAISWRERRRLSAFYARFFPKMENA